VHNIIMGCGHRLARRRDFFCQAFLQQLLLGVTQCGEAQVSQLLLRLVKLAFEIFDPKIFFLDVELCHGKAVAMQPVQGNEVRSQVSLRSGLAGRITD